jgi:hypothetical protein
MIKSKAFVAACALVSAPVSAESVESVPAEGSAAAPVPLPVTPTLLKRDTPVELMATKEISTADASPGTRFKLRVNHPILAAEKIVVPAGAWAFGEVVTAEDSGGLGKSGRMTARLLYLQLGDAQVPLEGQTSAKGTGAGSAGVAVLFTGVVGLFHRGNNAKIKAGELLNGFVSEDIWLDLAANPIQRVAAPAPVPSVTQAQPLQ